jgi:hypothetical protein
MYFQLVPSTHRTDEIEFGLLPTPRAMEVVEHPEAQAERLGDRTGGKLNNLSSGAKFGMLPTPTAMDSTGATANMKSSQVKDGSMHSVTLSRFVGMLPTPMASDCGEKVTGLENQDSLVKMAREVTGKTSQLNPQFVCEMMGFPVYWCDM